ncbi:uncharacterized protein LOC114843102 isoform X2 [Betta splendens]|uniref:Uncharacterized protein LOC114843102 isoform X2 n=1 Tax=Betta splendens TaxID=158456 RepID=A0A6P7KUA3_BETSP|nr:uncharacterized protein LOC114843102 isoform X2 [Betta splendens]
MQSPSQTDGGPEPVTGTNTAQPSDTGADPQPAHTEPEAQEKRMKSAVPIEAETLLTPQENATGVITVSEAPTTVTVTQMQDNETVVQSWSEHSESTGKMEIDSDLTQSAQTEPDSNANGPDVQRAKKQDKGVRDSRKYVPSKKAMIDPLKMDMSKPLVIPLTSSELSLQCMECHIIFSDHKSKERHLKSSHPAEYEQCILRNALFACYVCDRHFTNSTELMAHQKAHTEKKPFKCPICGQAFNKSSELTVHKKVHFGQDGYACTDCGKACKTLTLLKYHRRTHTGERPYVCKECGKRFTMSKALQKHIVSHLSEGAEGNEEDNTAKAQLKIMDGASSVKKYSCSLCKATFKSTKTRLHHMKRKHSTALGAEQQMKQGAPIITPISICQPALLQVEPNGPLQKVDANIDTEQICRLIESLGNVRKVNQVVILGQVPPHAPPLEVQQLTQMAEPMNLNLNPPQIDLLELQNSKSKAAEMDSSNNPYNLMEQTIILEPITPDGQLENPSFVELGSHIATAENLELTLVQSEQTQRPEGEVMHQILQQSQLSVIQPDHENKMVSQNKMVDLRQDLEQTVILELTPALIPTQELEQSQTVPQNEIPSSSLVTTTELEKTPDQTPDQTVVDEQVVNLSVPPLMSTIELELTSLQTEQQDIPSCTFVPLNTFTQTQSGSETNSKEEVNSHMQTVTVEQVKSVVEGDTVQKIQEGVEQKPLENLLLESEQAQVQVENLPEGDKTSAKEDVPSQAETKQVAQITELPVNVMSAQELVKVRKRKPARAYIFQGYMQELVGSLYNEDLHIDAKAPKRKRAKKSHLVVRFSPQSKEKKNKKAKTPPQHHQSARKEDGDINLSETKVASQKKGRKGKLGKKVGQLVSTGELKTSLTHPQVQQNKEDTRKNKKQKEYTSENMTHVSQQETVASPVFKKKKQKAKVLQKNPATTAKHVKRKKNLAKEKQVNAKAAVASVDVPGPHVVQDSLLLLKGHKQPQLKVYKLDPSQASGQSQDGSPHESQQSKDKKQLSNDSTNNLTTEVKKKGGRPKKNTKSRTLLSSLNICRQPPEAKPTIPKTSRKRKASSKVEAEGVITSHSKRALECMDCGERFSEVSSLQKHKAMVHIIESPGLTYTNGNIFEGVSRSDLYHLPKQHDKVVVAINTATGWDTEPEMGETASEDKERTVSFPTLIPSPSLALPPDVDMSTYDDKGQRKTAANNPSHIPPKAHSPSDSLQTNADTTSECALSTPKSLESGEPLTSDGATQKDSSKHLSSKSEVQAATDDIIDDIKEDLLLEVDVVTVGEQNERDDQTSEDGVSQNKSPGPQSSESEGTKADVEPEQGDETATASLALQNVSCSTHQVQIKEEEEEMLVRNEGERNASTGRRQGTENLKQGVLYRDTVRETELEKEQDEHQGGHKQLGSSDSEICAERETCPELPHSETSLDVAMNEPASPAAHGERLPSTPSTLEESPEEQVVFELESVSTSVEKLMNNKELQGGDDYNRETNQSPGIILEKFLTSSQRAGGDIEPHRMTERTNGQQVLDSLTEHEERLPTSEEIKVEENISDPHLAVPSCPDRESASVQPQNHGGIRSVLVKQEARLIRNDAQASHDRGQIRWNVEPVNNEDTTTPIMESVDTTGDCCITPEFNTNQCIFYPVKEEEREVLLGPAETSGGSLTLEGSADAHQTGHQTADSSLHEDGHPMLDNPDLTGLLSEPVVGDSADVHGPDAQQLQPSDLRNFLLQSSNEEELDGLELSDPHVDSEEEIMASFYKNQTNGTQQPSLPASTNQLQASTHENTMRQPIDYFSRYFDWDTWLEIVSCTNKQSKMSNAVTAREVALFVGIHIAMGTLKFPSLRLYWDDLTKVPLIAEAMPFSRFLELSRMLKLASPAKDSVNDGVAQGRHNIDFQNVLQGPRMVLSRPCAISEHSDGQREGVTPNNMSSSKVPTDPLWKVQPLLSRFRAGCQSLRRDNEYAVDQHPLVLTGKVHSTKLSLCCTTLIGFGGFILHVDLKLDRSDKEDAVEKMVPKGSMVFLCKQELSTPAMLERLLAAGVHGAGRVGGARGQIGDEFVSSDGKLMLRRSHCGFLLSTAGPGRRNMASLIDNFEKAQVLARLNRDLLNLYSIPLTASAPACWPQAVLWYLTDVALVNSWLLYRQDHKAVSAPLTLMAFRLEVSKALILSSSSDTQDSVPPHPPTETAHTTNETLRLVEESPLPDAATRYDGSGHWPEQLGEGEGGRCRFGDCQRTSRVLCLKCCVFLCISRNHNCFLNFHNQESLGKL